MNIWKQLPKPIFCLAPMEDVTDTVFRQLLEKFGKPPLQFTEFVNVHGIYSHSRDIKRLEYTDSEKPLILQIWGIEPELYYQAAEFAVALGYDGVDINMGCPQKKIVKKGACSALINNRTLAKEIIQATLDGTQGKIPVSVKTRIGFDQIVSQSWAEDLLKFPISALTVHGRTSKQMSAVPANWNEIAQFVEVRDSLGSETLILGNGDVLSLEEAKNLVEQYKVDGVMIGRGIFQNPWLFSGKEAPTSKIDKLAALEAHIRLWKTTWQSERDFNKLKRFFKIYCNGFDGASQLRSDLMEAVSSDQALKIIASE